MSSQSSSFNRPSSDSAENDPLPSNTHWDFTASFSNGTWDDVFERDFQKINLVIPRTNKHIFVLK